MLGGWTLLVAALATAPATEGAPARGGEAEARGPPVESTPTPTATSTSTSTPTPTSTSTSTLTSTSTSSLPSPLPAPSNVQVWEPACDPATRTLSFKVTWDPALLRGRPWPRYLVSGTQCAAPRSVTCCEARVTGCSPGTHLGAVQADYGELEPFARSSPASSMGSANGAVFLSGACRPAAGADSTGYRPRS